MEVLGSIYAHLLQSGQPGLAADLSGVKAAIDYKFLPATLANLSTTAAEQVFTAKHSGKKWDTSFPPPYPCLRCREMHWHKDCPRAKQNQDEFAAPSHGGSPRPILPLPSWAVLRHHSTAPQRLQAVSFLVQLSPWPRYHPRSLRRLIHGQDRSGAHQPSQRPLTSSGKQMTTPPPPAPPSAVPMSSSHKRERPATTAATTSATTPTPLQPPRASTTSASGPQHKPRSTHPHASVHLLTP